MAEPYKRLEEAPTSLHQPTAVDVDQINSFLATAASGKIRRLKMYKAMVILSFAEASMAALMLLLGTTCTILRQPYGHSCQFGTAVWVGLICMMAGILGIIALKVPEGRKGFMLAYLVLCIFSCVADGVLMIFSAIWVSMNSFMRGDSLSKTISTISLNSTLLIISFTHMIITIISTAFICYNWSCCDKKPGVVIFYVPQSLANNGHPENVQFLQTEGINGEMPKPVIA